MVSNLRTTNASDAKKDVLLALMASARSVSLVSLFLRVALGLLSVLKNVDLLVPFVLKECAVHVKQALLSPMVIAIQIWPAILLVSSVLLELTKIPPVSAFLVLPTVQHAQVEFAPNAVKVSGLTIPVAKDAHPSAEPATTMTAARNAHLVSQNKSKQ